MARITVEDCLKNIPNRFELTLLAAKRARHLVMSAEEPMVPWENDKSTVVALREIAAGLVTPEFIAEQEAQKAESAFLTPDEMLAQVASSMAELSDEEQSEAEIVIEEIDITLSDDTEEPKVDSSDSNPEDDDL